MGISRRTPLIVPLDGVGFPSYALHRLRRSGRGVLRRVAADRLDVCKTPFIVEFCIRKRLVGARRKSDWGKSLLLVPKKNNAVRPRWDLKVRFDQQETTYHRLVCLACVPCTTGMRGEAVEPFRVPLGRQHLYEADHIHGGRDCRRKNLQPLYAPWHRSKRRTFFMKAK